eukprot:1176540-Prorocentrum_minimum.AAC.2
MLYNSSRFGRRKESSTSSKAGTTQGTRPIGKDWCRPSSVSTPALILGSYHHHLGFRRCGFPKSPVGEVDGTLMARRRGYKPITLVALKTVVEGGHHPGGRRDYIFAM